jgi:hypothetical protein
MSGFEKKSLYEKKSSLVPTERKGELEENN